MQTGCQFRFGKAHIEEIAFIGCKTVICNYVTIEERAIIGAGRIVTKDPTRFNLCLAILLDL